jgi:hypothetical protein
MPLFIASRAYKKSSTPSLLPLLSPSQRSLQADEFLCPNPPLLPPCFLRFGRSSEVAPPLLGLRFFPGSGAPSDIFISYDFTADRARHQSPKHIVARTSSVRLSASLLDTPDDADHTLELAVTSHVPFAPSLSPETSETPSLTTTWMQRHRFLNHLRARLNHLLEPVL